MKKKRKNCKNESTKNKVAVYHIGVAILKRTHFDFTEVTEKDLQDIIDNTTEGKKIISTILKKAIEY